MTQLPLPVLVTDLDGVLCDIMSEIMEQVWDAIGVALCPEDCTQYDVTESFAGLLQHKLNKKDLEACLQLHIWENPDVYRRLRPYWEVHKAYQAWVRAGGGFVVLTGRPARQSIMSATQDWLCSWGYGGASVHMSRDHGGKAAALKVLVHDLDYSTGRPPEVWVAEDDPAQAASMAEVLAADADVRGTVYLIDRPWSRNSYGGLLKKRYLVQDIQERLGH